MSPYGTQEMGLRWRKKLRQHNDIVETTVQLVREAGYEATTVEEIARRLEISTATFYNYFRSKDDVLATWVQRVWDQSTDEVLAGHATFQRLAKRLAKKLSELLERDKGLWCAIALKNAWSPIDHASLRSTEERAARAVAEVIERAQEKGELRRDIPAWRLGQQLDGMLVTACAFWATDHPRPHSLRRSLDQTVDLFLRGTEVSESP